MSIVNPTELFAVASGSVGETVFSRNQHGPYTRDRTFPTDPATPRQLVVRAALAECVNAWKNTLTGTERQDWDAFALAVRKRNALGRSTNAHGLGMYIRANVPRIQAAVGVSPRVDQAPAIRTSPPFTPITRVVLNIVDNTIHPFFDEADTWVTLDDAAMLFYASAPQVLARNFWAGPYRFAGSLLGSSPRNTSPGTIPLPTPAGVDQRVFVQARLTLPDARISEPFRLPADIVPQVTPFPGIATIANPAGPIAVVTVPFDALLRLEPHSRFNWFVRFNGIQYDVLSVVTDNAALRINTTIGPADPGIDVIVYTPPPFDVHGLLTGIAVPAFQVRVV